MSSTPGPIQRLITSIVPWFLQGTNVSTFLESIGLELDGSVESLAQGFRLAHPLRCDASALPVLSRDREVRLYQKEPEASKRARLAQWLPLRRARGTHIGEMRNLQPFFLPDALPRMRVVHQDGLGNCATWWTLNGDGSAEKHRQIPSNFNWDNKILQWSRWHVQIYTDTLASMAAPAKYNGGAKYDDGTLYDGDPSGDMIADMIAALLEAKAAQSALWSVCLCPSVWSSGVKAFDPTATSVTDPAGWTSLPIGNWGFPIDNVTGVPSRPPEASFILNRGQAT